MERPRQKSIIEGVAAKPRASLVRPPRWGQRGVKQSIPCAETSSFRKFTILFSLGQPPKWMVSFWSGLFDTPEEAPSNKEALISLDWVAPAEIKGFTAQLQCSVVSCRQTQGALGCFWRFEAWLRLFKVNFLFRRCS